MARLTRNGITAIPAYHQIGHHSENLIFEPELAGFHGAILSPVNYDPEKTQVQIKKAREQHSQGFDLILDPQLYAPRSDRGQLRKWRYFPADVDTIDLSTMPWWNKLNAGICAQAAEIKVDAACSPVILPKADQFTDAYFAQCIETGADFATKAKSAGVRPIQTAVVGLKELALEPRPMQVATIISRSATPELYLIFLADVPPRRELDASDQLEGAVKLIRELKRSQLKIIVGSCAADMVIWKSAGADSCTTGKFFNLRRFSRNRFEEPDDGGRNLPYFFEEALFAFLREADIKRLQARGVQSASTITNPFAQHIFKQFKEHPGTAWLAEAWRQYLYWFAECETRISKGESVDTLLKNAEELWLILNNPKTRLLFEEPTNDGAWIRPWRIATLSSDS